MSQKKQKVPGLVVRRFVAIQVCNGFNTPYYLPNLTELCDYEPSA